MKWILLLILCIGMNDEIVIFDGKSNQNEWNITNDTVMGGVSNSSMKIDETGKAIFSGEVSTENNGGFAMTRLPVKVAFEKDKRVIKVKLKGDGKQYQFRLKSSKEQRYWYVQNFKTTNQKEEIILSLAEFYPSYRGRKLDFENFSANKIEEIAILIGNKKDEQFSLAIEKITIQ
ncbi:CIA30 family protein [Tenacibaculum tangerinum]|uniref:CIA30 family protein n=1 Tax=Tenacibaculum tangerinum TaxID=3038772 RepID=A0ABY8L0V3_9FLAO|nr:CIA30 family protein [Tenacibaculum tangerinum]WGH74267.1 CIA30 family protein [Tenacibaculum tangerinum]